MGQIKVHLSKVKCNSCVALFLVFARHDMSQRACDLHLKACRALRCIVDNISLCKFPLLMPSQGVLVVLPSSAFDLYTQSHLHLDTSCLFPVPSEDNWLGGISSVLIRCLCTTIALRSDLLLKCMQVYSLIQTVLKALFTESYNIVTFLFTCKRAPYSLMFICCLLWQLCVLHYSISPSPTPKPCGNILDAQNYKTLI